MKLAAFFLMAGLLAAQEKDQRRQRGQSGPPDQSQSWSRGRLGSQIPLIVITIRARQVGTGREPSWITPRPPGSNLGAKREFPAHVLSNSPAWRK